MIKYFTFPSSCPDPAQSRMVSSKPLCCRSTSLLRLSHQPPPPTISVCCGLHAAFTSRDACPVSPAGPYNAVPHSYQPSASTVVLPPGKHSMENQSHQHLRSTEKMNVAVLNQPKMQRKISLPLQTEREGKSGRSLNRLERCPNHWKLVIGLYFTLPPEK